MIISLLYEFVMLVGFLLSLPSLLYHCVRYGKYRASFLQRFGKDFPKISRKNSGPIVWVHAVSVGECQAVASLLLELKKELRDPVLVVSSITETGHAEAKKTLQIADYHVYMPFDFWGSVTWAFHRCKPDIVILCEGDFWYRFLKSAKKKGSVICLVNGKISHRSVNRLKCISFFSKKLFSLIDFFCVQSELYRDRFRLLSVSASKIAVTGNLKCDAPQERLTDLARNDFTERFEIAPSDFVVVIGSTHDPEEKLLLDELAPLFDLYPHLKVILAPRHPERFAKVAATLEEKGLSYSSWSGAKSTKDARIFLLDAMGILRYVYQLADVAIIGGSFTTKIGGHNILEAQSFGVPVIVGPHMHTQAVFIECSHYYDAIVQVEGNEVGQALKQLILSPERRKVLKEHSLKMYKSLSGSTLKTIKCIKSLAPQFFRTKTL